MGSIASSCWGAMATVQVTWSFRQSRLGGLNQERGSCIGACADGWGGVVVMGVVVVVVVMGDGS